MKDNYKNMEDLFRESLSDYSAEISSDGWQAVAKGTTRKLFFRFIPNRFNIYYLAAGVVLAAVFGTSLFVNNGTGEEFSGSIENIELPKKSTNEEIFIIQEDETKPQEDNFLEDSGLEEESITEENIVEESVIEESDSGLYNEPAVDGVENNEEQLIENQPVIENVEMQEAEPVIEDSKNDALEEEDSEGTILQFETEIIEESSVEEESQDTSIPSTTVKDSIDNRKPDTVIKKEEKIHYIEKLKKTRRKNK